MIGDFGRSGVGGLNTILIEPTRGFLTETLDY